MKATVTRVPFLDFLRIIACFLVIVNHTTGDIFLVRTPEGLTWKVAVTYFFLSKVAVPVYFMITGYLLLSKPVSWKKHWQRIYRIILVIIIAGVAYWLYHGLWQEPGTPVEQILENIKTIYYKIPSNALWYLYNYLAILLMLPYFQKMADGMSKTDYHIFFLIYAVFVGTVPVLRHYFPEVQLNSNFGLPLFGGHITMLFIGQYFHRFGIRKTRKGFVLAVVLFTAMLAFNAIGTYYEALAVGKNYLFLDNRNYLPIMVQSACVFYCASCLRFPEKLGRIISRLGSCTFAMYLLSDMAVDFLKPLNQMLCGVMHPLFAVVLYEMAVFALCLCVTIPLRKIPGLKKLL